MVRVHGDFGEDVCHILDKVDDALFVLDELLELGANKLVAQISNMTDDMQSHQKYLEQTKHRVGYIHEM